MHSANALTFAVSGLSEPCIERHHWELQIVVYRWSRESLFALVQKAIITL